MTVGFISLGCPKNQVDSELMIAKLAGAGYEISDDLDNVDIVVINTCAFIEDAKKEAIENIFDMVSMKEDGLIKKIVVTGCLAERYRDEVIKEIPELSAVVGLGANGDIVDIVNAVAASDEHVTSFPEVSKMPLCGERILTTPAHWAYLKIADGCSNRCAYCAIPSIRGDFRSRDMDGIVAEAEKLVAGGAKELILIAQDTTRYGEDIYGEPRLWELLDRLNGIDGLMWIRILYCYPSRISDELLASMARNDKVLHYIDLPLQHASGKVLKSMNRPGDKESLLALVGKIRAVLPDAVLRTTMITGFPGETEEDVDELVDFIEKARFDRLGCFTYSKEEGTPAYDFDGQVDEHVKVARGERVMRVQNKIFEEKLSENIGKVVSVIVDGYDGYSDSFYGRSWMDAPDIDSVVCMTSPDGYEPKDGEVVQVKIFTENDGDLIGEIVSHE